MNMHIMILMNLHAKYIAKNKLVIYYELFVFLIKTDKGFDKATFENQMSVMRGQVRLLFYIFIYVFVSTPQLLSLELQKLTSMNDIWRYFHLRRLNFFLGFVLIYGLMKQQKVYADFFFF